ncbi:Stealth CR1 domain-containing protein [Brachybacterium alimentarium]|uniref:Stealth CR1 domain-containing protein n=1 Tax=Brachybacterium alimentarium TaxID=47845 RepID=UPI003FD15A14
MKLTYVLTTADARAGTEKTFSDQTRAMTQYGHDVEVASVYRLPTKGFDYGDDVRMEYMTALAGPEEPGSIVVPPEWDNQFCLATDTALMRYFAACTADIVVTSTPVLTMFALLSCPAHIKIVQQEHRPSMARGRTAVPLLRHSPRVDALVALTERNAEWLHDQWRQKAPRIEVIPNALPATGRPQSSGTQKVVMGAGRLVRSKGFSNLVRAFARVADEFPDWRLRIFGDGPHRDHVISMARNLGVARQVEIFPPTDHIEKEWARASIGALASTYEGLPLVLLEARGAGLPLVAYDCETGPREIIEHGKDGYLVKEGDIAEFASALRILMGDDQKRAEMSSRASESLRRFSPDVVAAQWQELFVELASRPESARQKLDAGLGPELENTSGSGEITEEHTEATPENKDREAEGGEPGATAADVQFVRGDMLDQGGDQVEARVRSEDEAVLKGIEDDAARDNETSDGDDVIACTVDEILPVPARENNRRRLEALFKLTGIAGRAVKVGSSTSWAAPLEGRKAVLEHLVTHAPAQLEVRLYAGRTRLDVDGFSWRSSADEVQWTKVTRLFLFHHFSVPETRRFIGYAGGLELTFWDEDERRPGLYRAARRNAEVDLLRIDQFDQQLFAPWTPLRNRPLWSNPQFPIDAVYTWVDGSDETWRRKRDGLSGDGRRPNDLAGGDIRYTNRDEIRYSLRSLNAFAPWIRNIYIVTDGQRPDWLVDGEGVTIVDHRDLFPELAVLPVFNSHAIETVLHRIPGLAEHFLYMNDDMFLLREQSPEKFFTQSGQAKIFLSPTKINDLGDLAEPHEAAAMNNRALIERDFGVTITNAMLHTPYPHKVSVLTRACKTYAEQIRVTQAAKFRSSTDVSLVSSLAQHFGALEREYVQGSLQVAFVSLGARDALRKLSEIPHRRLDCIAFGEADDDPDPAFTQEIATTFMRSTFQVPGPWER